MHENIVQVLNPYFLEALVLGNERRLFGVVRLLIARGRCTKTRRLHVHAYATKLTVTAAPSWKKVSVNLEMPKRFFTSAFKAFTVLHPSIVICTFVLTRETCRRVMANGGGATPPGPWTLVQTTRRLARESTDVS